MERLFSLSLSRCPVLFVLFVHTITLMTIHYLYTMTLMTTQYLYTIETHDHSRYTVTTSPSSRSLEKQVRNCPEGVHNSQTNKKIHGEIILLPNLSLWALWKCPFQPVAEPEAAERGTGLSQDEDQQDKATAWAIVGGDSIYLRFPCSNIAWTMPRKAVNMCVFSHSQPFTVVVYNHTCDHSLIITLMTTHYLYTTPFKKSNATPLWSIISICLWVYIHHVRYHLKAWLFVFPLILHLSWLLCRNVRRVIKLGSMSKNKCCKIGPQH